MTWLDITATSSIPNGEYQLFTPPSMNMEIAVFNVDNQFFAIENRCPHQNLPLADGPITNDNITCPFHGAVFSLTTGKVIVQPDGACANLTVFPVKVENDIIKIKINK